MAYKRQNAPKEYDPYWMDQELERLEQQLLGPDALRLKEWNTAPAKPRKGDVYLADGTNWDPGAGAGTYVFDGSGFVLLGFDQLIEEADLADNAVTTSKIADNAVTTAKILNSNVTLAKLANLAAQRVIGSIAGGTPEEVTVQNILDWIGSEAQGDLIYRASSAWGLLAAGTSGHFLKTQGTGADPIWAAQSPVLITSGLATNVANIDIPLDDDSWDRVRIMLEALVPETDNTSLQLQFDQGSGFLTGASDYQYDFLRGTTSVPDAANSSIVLADAVGTNTHERLSLEIVIPRPSDADMFKNVKWYGGYRAQNAAPLTILGWGELIANDDAIITARLSMSADDIASVRYYALGEKYA